MNLYVIDYGYATAPFYTEATDPDQVRREFHECANECFGIRKSITDYRVTETHLDAELPILYRGQGATHYLSFLGDEYLFDRTHKTPDGEGWKLYSCGGWCSCRDRGTPDPSCFIHEYYTKA